MDRIELRSSTLELIETNDNEMILEGYVNKTNEYSQLLGGRKKFKERILSNAFKMALGRAKKVDLLLEHDPKNLLASTKNGSLELVEDSVGLKMRAKIVPTTLGKDVYELVKAGLIDGMSFGFKVLKDNWKKLTDNTYLRDVVDLDLFEVTITQNPAYLQSSISARNLDIVEDVVPENVEETTEQASNKATEEKEVQKVEDKTETSVEASDKATEEVVEKDNSQSVADVVSKHIEPIKTQEQQEEVKEEVVTLEKKQEEVGPAIDVQQLISSMKEELKNELLNTISSKTEEVAEDTKVEADKTAPIQESNVETTKEESKEQVVKEDIQASQEPKEKPDYSKYYKELLALK